MPGTINALPNFSGELYTADKVNTPILTAIGGISAGGLITANKEFATASQYQFPGAAQPQISEDASVAAPASTLAIRNQIANVTQIHQRAIRLTYEKLANSGRLQGLNTAGQSNSVSDELAFQIDYNLKAIARDIEFSILNGTYNLSAQSDEADTTRGLIAATLLAGSTRINAAGVALSKALIDQLLLDMHNNGAPMENLVFIVSGTIKQQLSAIYGFAPTDRNVGGVNIKQIETDFGEVGIMPAHRFMPATGLLAADMSVVKPVFQPVPGKGIMFYEPLAKTGASEQGQLFGKFGLDHGPAFAHGYIENLV